MSRSPESFPVNGVDVSRWQSPDRDRVIFAGCEFVFARGTYGIAPDDTYTRHEANARKMGAAVVGAYCFGRHQSGAAQARALLAVAPRADLYVLDREADGSNMMMSIAQAKEFVATIKAETDKPVGLYASEAAFVSIGQDFDWVANWSAEPKRHWDFWQFRGSPLDLDVWRGSLDELRTFAGVTKPAPQPQPKPEPVVPKPPKPAPKPAPKPKPRVTVYVVRTGDTLWGIAQAHGTTVAALLRLPGNRRYVKDPSRIHPGDKVVVPYRD